MSMWDDIEDSSEAEVGGTMTIIPDGTGLIASIESAKNDSYEDDEFINVKWRVVKPAEFANRIIFHKLKIKGTSRCKDPEATAKRHKAMLGAIDKNAGGKMRSGKLEPTDENLQKCLTGRVMAIKVAVWEIGEKSGNYVQAVAPAKGDAAKVAPPPPPTAPADDDEDLPF